MATFRLDKWLSSQGVGSRKDVGQIIRSGRVKVDGEIIKKPETKIEDSQDISVDNKALSLEEFVYYMMNKPSGVLSATRDKKAKTVLDLLPAEFKRPGLFPAGRLDKDTEGFMFITNDGDFAHKVLSPKNKVPKTYLVHLNKSFNNIELTNEFEKGVTIGHGQETTSAKLKVLEMGENHIVELIIHEGMFHQVKRMFLKFDLEVIYLKRIKIGNLNLDPLLELGETRKINQKELNSII